ncbi:MAG: hypothetical protein JWP85_2818 [Rhodoglobus sp.]|nr:hypothetical protein [Rhodoglobus sp.]
MVELIPIIDHHCVTEEKSNQPPWIPLFNQCLKQFTKWKQAEIPLYPQLIERHYSHLLRLVKEKYPQFNPVNP